MRGSTPDGVSRPAHSEGGAAWARGVRARKRRMVSARALLSPSPFTGEGRGAFLSGPIIALAMEHTLHDRANPRI
jgi:hypothetical protein